MTGPCSASAAAFASPLALSARPMVDESHPPMASTYIICCNITIGKTGDNPEPSAVTSSS